MEKRKLLLISVVPQVIILIPLMILFERFDKSQDSSQWIYLLMFLIVILIIINLYILIHIVRSLNKAKELEMIKTDLKNTEALIDLLRKQGHDHINHIQTVTSMLMLEEHAVALDYLQGIANNYRFTGHFLRLGNPTLTALINTKKELANQKGVQFIVEKYCRVKLKNIKPWDLASIVGNLLENAMEYVLSHGELPQTIYFHLENSRDLKGYLLKISNPYQDEGTDFGTFFQQGFSSKSSSGRGYGLSIVKNLVEQYNGKLEVFKEEQNITFQVELRD